MPLSGDIRNGYGFNVSFSSGGFGTRARVGTAGTHDMRNERMRYVL